MTGHHGSKYKLSILIPAFNEKATLCELLDKVQALPVEKEIIIVDDNSTDGSRLMIQQKIEGKFANVRVIYNSRNFGKGGCIRQALKITTGELVVIQDADLEYDPADCLKIYSAFEQGADVVYGTRFKDFKKMEFVLQALSNKFLGSRHKIKHFHHFFGVQVLTFLANLLYGSRLTDEATCYKAFRKVVLDQITLKCRGFEFCPEVTAKVLKRGYRIVEVPVTYYPRSYAEGKKINWRHGVEAIWALIRFRFSD